MYHYLFVLSKSNTAKTNIKHTKPDKL